MRQYRGVKKQRFTHNMFSIVPIRHGDRYRIMKWRNDQMYHLRQNAPLTEEQQDLYFDTVVAALFEQERPEQLLFSYLKNEACIGYGGLVHIDWINNNAEISFIMDTALEKDSFKKIWSIYLHLIEKVAFEELQLHKIYTYAYDVRPQLFEILIHNKYSKEAVLKKHVLIDTDYKDVLIHSKFNPSK